MGNSSHKYVKLFSTLEVTFYQVLKFKVFSVGTYMDRLTSFGLLEPCQGYACFVINFAVGQIIQGVPKVTPGLKNGECYQKNVSHS